MFDVPTRIHPFLRALEERDESGNLVARSLGEHVAAAARGWHVHVEDVTSGDVVACAACFEMPASGAVELANAAVRADHRGLGLHPLLTHLRAARLALSDERWTRLVCATVPGSATDRNIARMDWREWYAPSQDFLEVCVADGCARRCAALAGGRACCCRFWELGPATHRRLVADLLAADDHAVLRDGAAVALADTFWTAEERARLAVFARLEGVA